jgi:multisubunit Na+/H+ antiporter MnhC subunit
MQEILDFLNSPEFMKWVIYGGISILIAIGLFGIMKKKNIIKIIMAISILETAVNMLLISIVYESDKTAPIFTNGKEASQMVDPVPQALVLTAIVIGVAVLALGLSIAVKYYKLTGISNISKMRSLKK